MICDFAGFLPDYVGQKPGTLATATLELGQPVKFETRSSARLEALAPPRRSLSERFYYPELDAIRIFLFLGVWSYHVLPREPNFYTDHHIPQLLASAGVVLVRACMCSLDVFFILSAFLITELLLRERALKGAVDLKAFYFRRLLRIWPLYFFVVAVACLFSLFDRTQTVGWAYAISFLLFAGNWMMVFHGAPHGVTLVPLWSVSFEEQFYLLWPLVLRKTSKRTIGGIAVGLLLIASLARLFLLLHHRGGDPIWYNSFARLDSIACGILLALALHGRATFRPGITLRLGLLCLGMLAWLVVGHYCGLLNSNPSLAGGMIGYPLMSLGSVAIFLGVLGAAQDGFSYLKKPLLVYLGKISYGLYAFHMLSFRLVDNLFEGHSIAFSRTIAALCALALTFLFATASFRWLESPFLRWKQTKFTYVPSGAPSS